MKNFKNNVGKTIAFAGGAVTVADLAQPVAPFAAYIMGASAICCVILTFIKVIGKQFGEGLTISAYLASGLFVLSSVLYFYQASSEDSMQKGLIASHVSQFEMLQQSLGLMDKRLASIDTNLSSINKKVDDVKKETSDNPRKELANLGLTWTGKDFHSVVMANDQKTVGLYLRGGMTLDRNYDDGRSNKSILFDIILNQPQGWNSTLEMAHAYGYDFNKEIFHYYERGSIVTSPPLFIALIDQKYTIADKLVSLGADTAISKRRLEDLIAQQEKIASRKFPSCKVQREKFKTEYEYLRAKQRQPYCLRDAEKDLMIIRKAKRDLADYKEMLSHI